MRRYAAFGAVLVLSASLTACGSEGDGSAHAADPAHVAGVTVRADPKLHDALPEAVKSTGKVRVASDVPYPPFEMFVSEGSSRITGLDYDLAQALGGKLGVAFVFTPQKFDGIVPAIQAGKYDVAMSAMTDNKQRQKVLDFVDYSVSGTGILVEQGNPREIGKALDLCGLRVAAQAATNQADFVKEQQSECASAGEPKARLQTYPKDSDAQLALRSGKADAAVITKPAAGYIAKTVGEGDVFDLVDDPKARGGYDASPNGIGVAKSKPELTEAIQQALQQLIDEGTYAKILKVYGAESIGVKKATKNAAVD